MTMVVALIAVGIGSVLVPSTARADSCGGPVASGAVRVVIVVDPGEGVGGPTSACLVVPSGTTGAQLLARRASELGMPSPRYAGSGLLCAIDGYPSSGCGDRTGGGFAYWAYFSGTAGSWAYGSYNPFIRRMGDGDIEGWRYVSGSGGEHDPPPRLSPNRSLFPPLTMAPDPVSPGGSSGASDGASGTDAGSPTPTSGAGAASTAPANGSGAGDLAANGSGVLGTDGGAPAVGTDAATRSTIVDDVALVATTSTGSGSGAGQWLGVGVAIALALALGLGTVLRTRSRS